MCVRVCVWNHIISQTQAHARASIQSDVGEYKFNMLKYCKVFKAWQTLVSVQLFCSKVKCICFRTIVDKKCHPNNMKLFPNIPAQSFFRHTCYHQAIQWVLGRFGLLQLESVCYHLANNAHFVDGFSRIRAHMVCSLLIAVLPFVCDISIGVWRAHVQLCLSAGSIVAFACLRCTTWCRTGLFSCFFTKVETKQNAP